MRKVIFVLGIFTLLFLAGCGEPKEIEEINSVKEVEEWLLANVPNFTDESIVLPTEASDSGAVISWETLDRNIMDSTGKITLSSGSTDVILSYNIQLEDKKIEGLLTITVVAKTFNQIANDFENGIGQAIAANKNVKTTFSDIYNISWTSSNEALFSNDGIYTRPEFDQLITIDYTVTRVVNGIEEVKDYSFQPRIVGKPLNEKAREIENWITDNYIPNRVIDNDVTIPNEYTHEDELAHNVWTSTINWYPSNRAVISSTGKITQFEFDRYVNLRGEALINDQIVELSFDVIIPAKTFDTEEERLTSFLDAIGVNEVEQHVFNGYSDINQTYNYLSLYTNTKYLDGFVEKMIIPDNLRSPGKAHSGIEFITIHDTANENAGARAHANLQYNGYSAASWHFQVDDKEALQSIPITEYAHHAGDGSRLYDLIDTGVKADNLYPIITSGEDGYFYFNGKKSTIKTPGKSPINASGIYTEIGENGNYFLNDSYVSSFGYISNKGGNLNSISIETAVNRGTDYGSTLRHTSKLVADLLIEFDLDLDRVMKHNHFSGKHCPRAIIDSNYWSDFMDLVSMEKYARTKLTDYNFTWTSNSSLLNTNGQISLDGKLGDVLSYSVVVTNVIDESVVMNKTFSTKLV